MKKKNFILSLALFFSILPMTLFSACDKDTNCYLDVKVYDEAAVDPISGQIALGAPVSGAEVEIYQDGGQKYVKGVTSGSGVFSTYFTSPAIVQVKVVYKIYTASGQLSGERRGNTTVRLIEGETIEAKVTLGSRIY